MEDDRIVVKISAKTPQLLEFALERIRKAFNDHHSFSDRDKIDKHTGYHVAYLHVFVSSPPTLVGGNQE